MQPGNPFGQPISIGPAPGAEYVTFGLGGTPANIVPDGTLGARPVIPWGGLPPELQQAPAGPPPGAYDYLRRPTAAAGQWQPSVPVRSSYAEYSSPHAHGNWQTSPPSRSSTSPRGGSSHTYVRPTAAERDAERAAESGSFWAGFLGLLGAFVYCAPPWWIIATHNPTASAMSAGGVMQALVGLWACTTVIAGPIGVICFLGGVASLFRPRPARRSSGYEHDFY